MYRLMHNIKGKGKENVDKQKFLQGRFTMKEKEKITKRKSHTQPSPTHLTKCNKCYA